MSSVRLALLLGALGGAGASVWAAPPTAPAAPAQPSAPLAPTVPWSPVPGVVGSDDGRAQHLAAVAALENARAHLASLDDVARTISFPSVEMLIEDADRRAEAITSPVRDAAFVQRQLQNARAYADRLAAGADPYRDRGITGMIVKAYRDDFDGTLQPYAVYLPRGDAPAGGWPLLVSLHG